MQALLEKPQATRMRGRPTPPPLPKPEAAPAVAMDLARTRPMADEVAARLDAIPEVVAQLRLQEMDLSPFEAWVVTRIDGVSPARVLPAVLDLSPPEVAALLHGLAVKRVITLRVPVPELITPETLRRKSAEPVPAPRTNPHLVQRVIDLEREGNVDEAIRLLDLGIAQSPDAALLYNRLALVLIGERRDWARAEQLLSKAQALEPGNAAIQSNLNRARSKLGR
jgi:tetratricopeptide (TPR) repeat protein